MTEFNSKKLNKNDINSGQQYSPKDGMTAQDINAIIEGVLYNSEKESGSTNYDDLTNKPIIRADLTTLVSPITGAYYQHTGATTSDYIAGRIYFFNGNNYIAIDGYCSTLYTDYSFPESISSETFLKINNSVFTSYGEFNPAYIANGEVYGTVLSVSTVAPLSCEVLVNGIVYKYVYYNDNITTTKIDLNPKTFEKIATVTVTPDTDGTLPTEVLISADDEGNSFELTDFYIKTALGFTDSTLLYLKVNGVYMLLGVNNIGLKQNELRSFYLQYTTDKRTQIGQVAVGLTASGTNLAPEPSAGTNIQWTRNMPPNLNARYNPIKSVSIFTLVGTEKTIMADSTFELWGIRK